jgi:predicted nucleotidyltransferase
MSGLNGNIIQQICSVLSSFPQVDAAVLYGSRAKGNYKPGSDIDLTLKGNFDLSILNSISLKLDDLYLPYMFDLSIHHHINDPDMIDHISRVGIELYRKKH